MAITLRTTLTNAISATDTLLTAASVTGVLNGMYGMLGNELVQVTGSPDATALTVPVTRGVDSTSPTIHPAGYLLMFGTAPNFTNTGGFQEINNGTPATFNTLVGEQRRTYAASTTATLTAGQVANGLLLLDGTGGVTWTLPTAALLLTAFPGAMVGSSYRVILRNTGTGTVTVAAGTGATISGTATVATLNSKEFLIHWTAITPGAETYTIYSLGTYVF